MELQKSLTNFKKEKILITGALGLIGFNLTKSLLQSRAELILIDNNSKDKKKISFLKNKRQKINFIDISNEKEISNFFRKNKEKMKNLTSVVNLAAIDAKIDDRNKNFKKEFDNFENNLIRKSINVNLFGTLNICKEACKIFKKNKKGNIINVASLYSISAPNKKLYGNSKIINKPSDYIISKSSIPNLTKYIAAHYADRGIRANCIVPHGIENNHSKKFKKEFAKLTPIKRMCNVNEIISPLIFLLSEGSSYMNGSLMIVDGGWTAW